MEATEPIKKELDGRGIVYLYLASESSPLEAWHNMIPGIPGEHYRLDQEPPPRCGKSSDSTAYPPIC